jgi:adenine-specific DNA-methyltransferase
MARKTASKASGKTVETLKHAEAKRKNIPSAELQAVVEEHQRRPLQLRYPRNPDLDPQLVWRGKDEQDGRDLLVNAPPLYIQEKVHPKVLIDDLLRASKERAHEQGENTLDLFSDFNGLPKDADKTEFYRHDQNWSNRMILGDSLQVMASLAEREGLRGKVQCIYFDPPYGIRFNSNFQWSTTSREVSDGKADHISREPEQVKAFRDTWRDGIHSYLAYLRDRLTVARDLLSNSGSLFVQIGDENVHRVRAVMDEIFGEHNFIGLIFVKKTGGLSATGLKSVADYIVWYSRDAEKAKFRPLFQTKELGKGETTGERYSQLESVDGTLQRPMSKVEKENPELVQAEWRAYQLDNLTSGAFRENTTVPYTFESHTFHPGPSACWKTTVSGLDRMAAARRIQKAGKTLRYKRYLNDFPAVEVTNLWSDVAGAADKVYVVQTSTSVVARCLLMTTDPGDLVLDPTCGSGTTAYVAEQWGRRWITIDTSRVALALARARIMGARYSFYLLADSPEGQLKEAEVIQAPPSARLAGGDIRQGFVYERVPHITLKSISNNSEIDVICEKWQPTLKPLREGLNAAAKQKWQEWEIPREADRQWPEETRKLHAAWWEARIARQKEIDASIAAKAEYEYLYDRPYEDRRKVRVAGPFTVESLSPHRVLGVDENDELIDGLREEGDEFGRKPTFPEMILDNLRTAGVHQAHKADRMTFTSLVPWPGDMVCAEGRYSEGESEKRAAIFIGPEFGTVQRPDLVEAAREAADAGFDVLIACAFNYEAHTTEFAKLGRLPVLKARMNADLHMAEDLKNTGKGNLFVVFGEPDIDLLPQPDGRLQVKVKGVDVFKPQTGEVVSDGPDGIACWFIDTDYNEESFFVRHAYFLGANDPYGALKTTLKAEIDPEAWASLNSDTSRPFAKPKSGRIAVKVINHLGDEVMKVFRVDK